MKIAVLGFESDKYLKQTNSHDLKAWLSILLCACNYDNYSSLAKCQTQQQ